MTTKNNTQKTEQQYTKTTNEYTNNKNMKLKPDLGVGYVCHLANKQIRDVLQIPDISRPLRSAI